MCVYTIVSYVGAPPCPRDAEHCCREWRGRRIDVWSGAKLSPRLRRLSDFAAISSGPSVSITQSRAPPETLKYVYNCVHAETHTESMFATRAGLGRVADSAYNFQFRCLSASCTQYTIASVGVRHQYRYIVHIFRPIRIFACRTNLRTHTRTHTILYEMCHSCWGFCCCGTHTHTHTHMLEHQSAETGQMRTA